MLSNLGFQNSFIEFVFHTVLSERSKDRLQQILTDKVVQQVFKGRQIKKIIVKNKPQQVIVFVSYQKKAFVIKGFQFGKTDYLTGRKRAHLNTIQQILVEKTVEEIENLY